SLVDDHLLGVAALGDGPVDIGGVVGAHVPLEAALLESRTALLAGAAGVDQAAHAAAIADLPGRHGLTDLFDDAGDLMADGQREVRLAPLVADGVDVAVADPGGPEVDDHVIGPGIAPLDGRVPERLIRSGLLQGLDGDRHGGGPPG